MNVEGDVRVESWGMSGAASTEGMKMDYDTT